jgi:hypothetical protein
LLAQLEGADRAEAAKLKRCEAGLGAVEEARGKAWKTKGAAAWGEVAALCEGLEREAMDLR